MAKQGVMRIGIAQVDDAPPNLAETAEWAGALMGSLPDADIVLLPELALCGYDSPERLERMALCADSPVMAQLCALARRRGQGLAFGYAQRDREKLYNAMIAIGPDGRTLANYRKIHLWSGYETALFHPGEGLASFALGGLRFGMLICYDLEFPEAARALALRGLDCLLCVSATSQGYEVVPRQLVPARAYENGCYLAYANRGDTGGAFPCIGQSRLVGPNGAIIAASAGAGADFLSGEIGLPALMDWRRMHPYLADRRPDCY